MRVPDLDVAHSFYADKLAFAVLSREPGWLQLSAPGGLMLGFGEDKTPADQRRAPSGWRLGVSTSSLGVCEWRVWYASVWTRALSWHVRVRPTRSCACWSRCARLTASTRDALEKAGVTTLQDGLEEFGPVRAAVCGSMCDSEQAAVAAHDLTLTPPSARVRDGRLAALHCAR